MTDLFAYLFGAYCLLMVTLPVWAVAILERPRR
jgi:hypothetical protein